MIKILLGGSPCTYWSIAKTQNRETTPSGLGWELFENYLIAKEKFQPDVFIYENNQSAATTIKEEIRNRFGCDEEPNSPKYIEIDSALVSAQSRKRFYVHNCSDVRQPADHGILLRDIIENGVVEREKAYCLTRHEGNTRDYFQKRQTNLVFSPVRIGTIENEAKNKGHDSKQYRVYSVDGKATTLCGEGGGLGAKTGLYACPIDQSQAEILKSSGGIKSRSPGAPTPVYEVKDGQILIKGHKYPINLQDGYYIIRKLTVKECCRLQTLPEIEHYLYINFNTGEIWLDLQKTNAQYAAEKCHKSQKFAKSVQEIDLLEFVQFVENNTNIRLQQKSAPVLLSVHTNLEGLSNQKDCSRGLLKNANIAGKNLRCLNQEQTEIFAQAVVGITTMLRKIMQVGMVELRLKDKIFAVVKNGKMQFTLCGTEIMQLVKGADINMNKVKKAITSTILEVLPNLEICEQILTTLFCYVLNAIGGYILQKTNGEILLKIKTPYTYAVSNSQAYRGLGNGWSAEVIIHILSGALQNVPRDEKLLVLSLYDGIGTGRYCLDKMGFTNVEYHSFEIDKYAMQIAQSNYPDIIQHGDAFQVRDESFALCGNVGG